MFLKKSRSKNARLKRNREEDEGDDCTADNEVDITGHLLGKRRLCDAKANVGVSVGGSSSAAKEPIKDVAQSARDATTVGIATFASERDLKVNDDQKATADVAWETEVDRDRRAVLERGEKIGKEILAGNLERGIYRGQEAYAPIMNRREGAVAASKYTGVYGPVRSAGGSMRMTMRIDYNPEICKDYKETGYCGRGNTCKFMHDRTDYKSGWQLDQEYEAAQKKKQDKLQLRAMKAIAANPEGADTPPSSASSSASSSDSDSDNEDELPFACLLCRHSWTADMRPVKTLCNHYFCEDCAMKQYAKSSNCGQCGTQTNGIFNSATDLVKKIEEQSKNDISEESETED